MAEHPLTLSACPTQSQPHTLAAVLPGLVEVCHG